MVDVFRQVRRVLAPHGTAWINIGDSFNNRNVSRQSSHQGGLGFESEDLSKSWAELTAEGRTRLSIDDGEIKEKDLVGVPWMLALALRAGFSRCSGCGLELRTDLWPRWDGERVCIDCLRDGVSPTRIEVSERGWWLRAGIVWSKPNGMPESIDDRPTRTHEFVFMLAKSDRYFFDQDAVREPHAGRASGNISRKHGAHVGAPGAHDGDLGRSIPWSPAALVDADALTIDGFGPPPPATPDGRKVTSIQAGQNSIQHRNGERWPNPDGKNIRDVWEIASGREDAAAWLAELFAGAMDSGDEDLAETVWRISPKPYAGAHFAVMPEELARRCIIAGTPEHVCRICGTPRRRLVKRTPAAVLAPGSGYGHGAGRRDGGRSMLVGARSETVGWSICGCLEDGTELFERDALELIETPLGEGTGRTGIDPTPETGRRGLGRERADDAGVRPITRYEQRRYAAQLKASPHRAEMEAGVGAEAFAHYIRTDRSGARPIPPDALEAWQRAGWLEPVEPPDVDRADWPGKWRPGVVLDPFVGSGTVPKVARDHGRHAVGIDGKEDYVRLAIERNAQMTIFV